MEKWRSGPGARRDWRRDTFRFGREYHPNDVFDAAVLKSAASKTSFGRYSLPKRNASRRQSRRAPGPERHLSPNTTFPPCLNGISHPYFCLFVFFTLCWCL